MLAPTVAVLALISSALARPAQVVLDQASPHAVSFGGPHRENIRITLTVETADGLQDKPHVSSRYRANDDGTKQWESFAEDLEAIESLSKDHFLKWSNFAMGRLYLHNEIGQGAADLAKKMSDATKTVKGLHELKDSDDDVDLFSEIISLHHGYRGYYRFPPRGITGSFLSALDIANSTLVRGLVCSPDVTVPMAKNLTIWKDSYKTLSTALIPKFASKDEENKERIEALKADVKTLTGNIDEWTTFIRQHENETEPCSDEGFRWRELR